MMYVFPTKLMVCMVHALLARRLARQVEHLHALATLARWYVVT